MVRGKNKYFFKTLAGGNTKKMKKENIEDKNHCECDSCESMNCEQEYNGSCGAETEENTSQSTDENAVSEVETLKAQLSEKSKKCDEYLNMLQRSVAEFDNYKKRTAKERELLYSEITGDIISAFLPVVDNFERAIGALNTGEGEQGLKEGIELLMKQMKDVMKNLGVEEIVCLGEYFNPQLHNAVMHLDDEKCDENVIVEEFQKGYRLKDRVIRHSMVKVAN